VYILFTSVNGILCTFSTFMTQKNSSISVLSKNDKDKLDESKIWLCRLKKQDT
jgi:hypothetical protein